MQFTGPLRKMTTQYGPTIRYSLPLGMDLLMMNGLIGKPLRMTFTIGPYQVQRIIYILERVRQKQLLI